MHPRTQRVTSQGGDNGVPRARCTQAPSGEVCLVADIVKNASRATCGWFYYYFLCKLCTLLSAHGVGPPATLPVAYDWSNGKFRVMAQFKVLSWAVYTVGGRSWCTHRLAVDNEIISNAEFH